MPQEVIILKFMIRDLFNEFFPSILKNYNGILKNALVFVKAFT